MLRLSHHSSLIIRFFFYCLYIFFYYTRLLFKLQLILHENITDIYKSDYNWDQHTSMLMERCPDFNPLKYSRDVYFSHLGKKADCLHSNLIKEKNTPTIHCGSSNLESSSSHHSAKGRVALLSIFNLHRNNLFCSPARTWSNLGTRSIFFTNVRQSNIKFNLINDRRRSKISLHNMFVNWL